MSSEREIEIAPSWNAALLLIASLCACSRTVGEPTAASVPPCTNTPAAGTASAGRALCGTSASSASSAQSTSADSVEADAATSPAKPPAANSCERSNNDSAGSSSAASDCAPSSSAGAGGHDSSDAAKASAGSTAAANASPQSAGSSGSHAGTAAAGSNAAAGASAGTAAATGCNAANLIFCDDFEQQAAGGMAPAAPWMIANNGMGHCAIDTQTPAHSGKASVKVTSEGGYQTFFALTGAPVFPHDGALYLRLYMRLEAAMTSGHNTYYKAGASGNPSSDHETRMGVMNGMLMINQPAGDRGFLSNEEYYRDGNKPGVVFAPMTWVCVETFFDPTNKTIDVWVDGNEVKDLHHTDWEQDPIGALHFGFEKYAGPDATLWYDDIALSTQPIGCP